MATMDLELIWNSSDIAENNVITYDRSWDICSGIHSMNFTTKITDSNAYNYWDEVIAYEDGIKVGIFYISEMSVEAPGSTRRIVCQDGSKRLSDYFVSEMYEIQNSDYSKTWLEIVLNDAGITYSFNVSDSGVAMAQHSIGMDSAYSIVITLIQYSGWYMYFDPDGTLIIGKLNRDGDIVATLTDTTILNMEYEENDSMLRTRAVIWGNGISSEQTIDSPYVIDDSDIRSVVIANSYINNSVTADLLASELLNEFGDIERIKSLSVDGFKDISIGENVMIESQVYTGTGNVTSLSVSLSSRGVISSYVLDKRCPRLFGYYSPFYEGSGTYVYIGTWGSGVWRKRVTSNTWEEYNTGLTDLYIRDLYVKDGILVAVANNGYAYRRLVNSYAWLRIWHGDFAGSGYILSSGTTYSPGDLFLSYGSGEIFEQTDIYAKACTIDDANNIVIGYNYLDSHLSWLYVTNSDGDELLKQQITASGILASGLTISGPYGFGNPLATSYKMRDVAAYGDNRYIVSAEELGIVPILYFGEDTSQPMLGKTQKFFAQTRDGCTTNEMYTLLPVPKTEDNTMSEANEDYVIETTIPGICKNKILAYGVQGESNNVITLYAASGKINIYHKHFTNEGWSSEGGFPRTIGMSPYDLTLEHFIHYDESEDKYYVLAIHEDSVIGRTYRHYIAEANGDFVHRELPENNTANFNGQSADFTAPMSMINGKVTKVTTDVGGAAQYQTFDIITGEMSVTKGSFDILIQSYLDATYDLREIGGTEYVFMSPLVFTSGKYRAYILFAEWRPQPEVPNQGHSLTIWAADLEWSSDLKDDQWAWPVPIWDSWLNNPTEDDWLLLSPLIVGGGGAVLSSSSDGTYCIVSHNRGGELRNGEKIRNILIDVLWYARSGDRLHKPGMDLRPSRRADVNAFTYLGISAVIGEGDYTAEEDLFFAYRNGALYKFNNKIQAMPILGGDNCFFSKYSDTVFKLFNSFHGGLIRSFDISSIFPGATDIGCISSKIDDYDGTIYVGVEIDGTYWLKGIDTGGNITKDFEDIDLSFGDFWNSLSVTGRYISDWNFLYALHDYQSPPPLLLYTQETILNYDGEYFEAVLFPRFESKVEISKPSPIVVYNIPSGYLVSGIVVSGYSNSMGGTSDLHYGSIAGSGVFSSGIMPNYSGGIAYVTSGIFTSILDFGTILDLRIFDTNYAGAGSGFYTHSGIVESGINTEYTRYIGYTSPDGVYMFNPDSVELSEEGTGEYTTALIGFSDIGANKLEISNYGIDPYMFVSVSGVIPSGAMPSGVIPSGMYPSGYVSSGVFYQKNPESEMWTDMSVNIPSGIITIIRLDDSL